MKKYDIKNNIKIIGAVYTLLLGIIIVRLCILQVKPTQMVLGNSNLTQIEYTSHAKYNILDRNNIEMIGHEKKYILVIDARPFKLNNEEGLEELLALNFIMSSEKKDFNYTDIIKDTGKYYYTITKESYNKIQKLKNIKGIYTYAKNEYNVQEAWSVENILASIDSEKDNLGEFENNIISITKDNSEPTIGFLMNDKSIYINDEEYVSANANNKNIRLTIDKQWSEKIKEVLVSDDYSFLNNIGVVILEADTGKICAMVQKDESEANINLAIGQLGYEPGSIFKTLTEAIALDVGKINLSDRYICNGSICKKEHGNLSVEEALQVSCNDIFAKVGMEASYENLLKYTTNLGLYQKVLGIDGKNREEATGIMPTPQDGVSNFSIGQCVMVTPLQIAGAINAITNNGVYVKPSLIDAIVDNNGNVIENYTTEERRVFSETTAKLVQNNMHNVIWNGSGYEAKVEGIVQGGKTGTSTGEGGATNHGWFAGYFQLENKMYTMVVLAPNIGEKHPDGRELGGGNTGAPIYRDIVNSLIQLND